MPKSKQRLGWKFNVIERQEGHFACNICYMTACTVGECTGTFPNCNHSATRFPIPINHLIPNPILWRAEDELELELELELER